MIKKLLLALGALVALLVLALLAVIFVSPVTTLVVNSLAADKVDEFNADSVSAGFGGVRIKGLDLMQDGNRVHVDYINIGLSVWSAALSKELDISLVAVEGARIEAAAPTPGSEPAAPPTTEPFQFPGVHELSKLPGFTLIKVAEIRVDAEITLPSGQVVTIDLKGGKIVPGESGDLTFDATVRESSTALAIDGTGRIIPTLDKAGALSGLEFSIEIDGKGLPGVQSAHLATDLNYRYDADAGVEHYTLNASELHEGTPHPLGKAELTFDPSRQIITGPYDFQIDSENRFLSSFLANAPTIELQGEGTVSVALTEGPTVHVEQSFLGNGRRWERFLQELSNVSAIRAEGDFAFSANVSTQKVTLESLTTTILEADAEKPIFRLTSTTPFVVDPARAMGAIPVTLEGEPTIELDFVGVPLEWASSFFPDVTYRGERMTGKFSIVHREDLLQLECLSPLRIDGFSLSKADEQWIRRLDFSITPNIRYVPSSGQLTFESADLNVQIEDSDILSADAVFDTIFRLDDFKFTTLSAEGQFVFKAEPMLDQPIAAEYRSLLPDGLKVMEVNFDFGFDALPDFGGSDIRLTNIDTRFSNGEGLNAVRVYLPQAFVVEVRDGVPQPVKTDGNLLDLQIFDLDYQWVGPLVGEYAISGSPLKAHFMLRNKDGVLRFETIQPLQVEGFAIAGPDGEMITPLNFRLEPSGEFDRGQLRGVGGRAVIEGASGPLLDGMASLDLDLAAEKGPDGLPPLRLRSELSSSMMEIAAQPILGNAMGKPSRGDIRVESDVDLSAGRKARTRIQLDNLSFPQKPEESTGGFFDLEAEMLDDQSINVVGSLEYLGGDRSTSLGAKYRGSIRGVPVSPEVELEIEGDRIDIPTLLALLETMNSSATWEPGDPIEATTPTTTAVAETEEAESEKKKGGFLSNLFGGKDKEEEGDIAENDSVEAETTNAPGFFDRPYTKEPDEIPFWSSAGKAKVKVAVREILLPALMRLDDFSGQISVTPEFVGLQQVQGHLRDAETQVDGTIDFTDRGSRPYRLQTRVALNRFDFGDYLEDVMPFWGRAFEGDTDILLTLDTEAPNLEVLARTLKGDFEMEANRGAFNILALGGDEVLAIGKHASKAGMATSVINMFKPGAVNDDLAKKIDTFSRIMDLISGFEYDEMLVKGSRSNDLRVKLDEFFFRGDEMEITGDGYLTLTENMKYEDQPMDLDVRFVVRGQTAELFEDLRLVDLPSGYSGQEFVNGPRFRLRGTPEHPDWSDFISILMRTMRL